MLKIISGGQSGVDIAALRAAKRVGFLTGGWMPFGFKTLDGPKPEYAEEFGMVCTADEDYRKRTYWNVRDGQLTIQIASHMQSTGERCTYAAICYYDKPSLDIELTEVFELAIPMTFMGFITKKPHASALLVSQLKGDHINVVNFAGNSERTAPGIEAWAEQWLFEIFEEVATIRKEKQNVRTAQTR